MALAFSVLLNRSPQSRFLYPSILSCRPLLEPFVPIDIDEAKNDRSKGKRTAEQKSEKGAEINTPPFLSLSGLSITAPWALGITFHLLYPLGFILSQIDWT